MNINKLFVLISVFLIFAVTCFGEAEKIARVKTKENYIRESDRFYSQIKAKVFYDETLQVIGKKNEWLNVRYKDTEGWIHQSAVSESRKMVYTPVMLGADIDPDAEKENHEVALAGKGFTPDVEKKMGENDPSLNYAQIDEIVNKETPLQKISKFMKEGGLKYPK
ncbi:SH3 domain-containing protein [Desulforegula conservatrix]|uniref:SH3 domain-containing protein n=1 Tax=Desulforegula conservatrix TaxID=153026 RepID=UPI00040D9BD3|nr:SH3 domain-containing protein [Desulforegula conservatrix]